MAPTSSMLQGLNVVHQHTYSDNADPTDLAGEPLSQDLTDQLALWSNIHFATDEPLPIHDRELDSYDSYKIDPSKQQNSKVAIIDPALQNSSSPSPTSPNYFGYDSLLSNLTSATGTPDNGADSFGVPGSFNFFGHSSHPAGAAASSASGGLEQYGPTLSSLNANSFINPSSAAIPAAQHASNPRGSGAESKSGSRSAAEVTAPAAKKARTGGAASSRAKSSAASPPASHRPTTTSESRSNTFADDDDGDSDFETAGDGKADLTTPVTATEDKRRRNTAASARFRAKKKEREQAMEKRAKDLESRVGELERECEALRRENGWLKGLVVGVTGGVPGSGPSAGGDASAVAAASSYFAPGKRDRED